MNERNNRSLSSKARRLRREMTKEERHLWYDCLKLLPTMVHRQKVIGNYIVDFYIASRKLVIELDGSQHTDPGKLEYDSKRTEYLRSQGLMVLRFRPVLFVKRNLKVVLTNLHPLILSL